MDVRMVQNVLSPGVQNAHETNVSTQMLRIGRDLQQRFRAGAKQKIIQNPFVGQRQSGELMRQCEDNMNVRNSEQLFLTSRQPFIPSVGLTLAAMAISTRTIRDG